ncbi:hypothetical protein, partial [Rhizobium ecuadorense]|uniref:hypothetical protein n=1 Tax=Rhizobium ecuadorense TaxID=1671795 RepID=UPI001AEC337C
RHDYMLLLLRLPVALHHGLDALTAFMRRGKRLWKTQYCRRETKAMSQSRLFTCNCKLMNVSATARHADKGL